MTKEMYAVIHLFQGIVHEIKIFLEWDKAREAADKKIIGAYGELVKEQCGDDEIVLEQAELTQDDAGVLLDKAELKAALTERMKQNGLSVEPCLELDTRTEDFHLFVADALTGFLDEQYYMFMEETEK